MARYDEAARTIRILDKHCDLLSRACIENQGVIVDEQDGEKAIAELQAHRLVFRLDERDHYVQVNRVVSELFHHATQNYRRRLSSGAVDDLFDQLKHAISGYLATADRGLLRDQKVYESEIQEIVAHLIDTLREITQRFAGYVRNEFSMVSDLSQRIRENERAIKEASQLNDLFATLTPDVLAELARSDRLLSHLLKKVFGRAVSSCADELHDALHKLRENLTKLQDDQRYREHNELIDTLLQHYQRHPGYQPGLEQYRSIPRIFRSAERLELKAHPPIDSPTEERALGDIAQQALARIAADEQPDRQRQDPPLVPVKDCRDGVFLAEPEPVEQALRQMFEILPQLAEQQPASSLACLAYLDLEINPELWLVCVADHYANSDYAKGERLAMRFCERPLPGYSGNYLVEDIEFRLVRTAEFA
ncbi:hypothetical protein [Pseudomonas saliphila]|uniref:hypothetical protein n=1 Tax=Pseudomonas saliphila TaxID=2586906 RepID=UPI00123BE73A|nr:hypothetical protein [Pseudomonas saliphila]